MRLKIPPLLTISLNPRSQSTPFPGSPYKPVVLQINDLCDLQTVDFATEIDTENTEIFRALKCHSVAFNHPSE